jgi:hypothetical protein
LWSKNDAIENGKICHTCRLEIELAFTYYIGGKECTKEEYERRINEYFRKTT